MRILLDACAHGKQWDNIRKINNNVLLLKPNKKYWNTSDKDVIKFARQNNCILLSYDQDMYNLWLEEKNFNLIYVRNLILTQSRNYRFINGKKSCIKMSYEEKQFRQKIIETYITYIRKYLNSISDEDSNFVIRLGAFRHHEIYNCYEYKKNTDLHTNNNFLNSSIVFFQKTKNSFVLSYSDKLSNSKITREIKY